MAALEADSPWIERVKWRYEATSSSLAVDIDMRVGEALRELTLAYPEDFPLGPPSVKPRDPELLLSMHQYQAGGDLCLEFRPDNWQPEITGADMVASAYRLLSTETGIDNLGRRRAVPSAHTATMGQKLRWKTWRFVVTQGVGARLAAVVGAVPGAFHWRLRADTTFVGSLIALGEGDARWIDPESPPAFAKLQTPGFAIRLAPGDPRSSTFGDAAAMGSAKLRAALLGPAPEVKAEVFVVLEGESMRAFYADYEDERVDEFAIVTAQGGQRLPERYAAFAERKVGIVGCGSMGSKVAASLARAGVGNFYLVDDDVLLPENLARNDLDWTSVGAHKAHGVAQRIALANPRARVQQNLQRLGGQESSSSLAGVMHSLASCDLIVETSGDDAGFNYAAGVAQEHAKPMVWARVFGGGYGGILARSRPGMEAPPYAVRANIEAWCNDPLFPDPPTPKGGYEAETADGAPMIADDADVSLMAAHLSRMAIDTLGGADSAFESSAYAIGFRKEWIFKAAFDTRPIDLNPTPAPPAAAAGSMAMSAEAFADLVGIVTEKP